MKIYVSQKFNWKIPRLQSDRRTVSLSSFLLSFHPSHHFHSISLLPINMSSLSNPVNWVLAAVLGYISYNYFTGPSNQGPQAAPRPRPPALVFREYTPKELAEFDGRTEDTRILMAVQGKVFDVTRGRNFYGPGKTKKEKECQRQKKFPCLAFSQRVFRNKWRISHGKYWTRMKL